MALIVSEPCQFGAVTFNLVGSSLQVLVRLARKEHELDGVLLSS